MRICQNCGESFTTGGYLLLPGVEKGKDCCLPCALCLAKKWNSEQGKSTESVLYVKNPKENLGA